MDHEYTPEALRLVRMLVPLLCRWLRRSGLCDVVLCVAYYEVLDFKFLAVLMIAGVK